MAKVRLYFSFAAVTAIVVTLLMNSTPPTTEKTKPTPLPQHVSVGYEPTTGDSLPDLDAPHRSNPGSKSKLGYILVNHYSGQQGVAVCALGSLQCLAGSYKLPVKILEPFVVGRLTSDFPPNITSPLKFRDLFNLQHFNELSQREAEPPLAPWDDFLDNASRNVISISTNRGKRIKLEFQLLGDVRSGIGMKKLVMDTTKEQLCFSTKYAKNQQLSKLGICVVRVAQLKFPHKKDIADDDVYDYMYLYGDWDPRQTTLVFTTWNRRYVSWIQRSTSLGDFNCSDPKRDRIRHRLLPSQRLLKDSQSYTKRYLHSSNKVAMMVRSEHVFIGYRKKSRGKTIADMITYFSSCLRSAVGIAHENTQADGGIYLTFDLGTYGSNTIAKLLSKELQNKAFKIMQDTVADLYGNKLSLRDWEDSFTQASGGIDNPAYIAALQRTIASQADCLILVGGGNFQVLATNEYLRLHPNPGERCVHSVCLNSARSQIY